MVYFRLPSVRWLITKIIYYMRFYLVFVGECNLRICANCIHLCCFMLIYIDLYLFVFSLALIPHSLYHLQHLFNTNLVKLYLLISHQLLANIVAIHQHVII